MGLTIITGADHTGYLFIIYFPLPPFQQNHDFVQVFSTSNSIEESWLIVNSSPRHLLLVQGRACDANGSNQAAGKIPDFLRVDMNKEAHCPKATGYHLSAPGHPRIDGKLQ